MKYCKIRAALSLCAVMLLCAGCGTSLQGNESGRDTQIETETGNTLKAEAEDTSGAVAGEERIQMPDFEMALLDGETVTFEEYHGKKVLLNFWATWCGPCVGEMPAFQRLTEEYPEELVILAVNCSEGQETVQKFAQDNGYTFPIVLDTDGAIQAMFGGITSIPATVIIDEEGYIVSAGTGAADADTMYEVYREALGL